MNKQMKQHLEAVVEIERGLAKPLLKGDDVHRYEKIQTDKFVIFPYKLENKVENSVEFDD